MVYCPNCNTKCVKDANYCHKCGIYLFQDSDKSDKSNSPLKQAEVDAALRRLMPSPYIDKLISTKGQIEGERRIVTILFSDVKGSTSMAENLDPEDVLDIMNGAFEVLIEPITKYEGTIARLMGDAILAFFGAPIAHEDDPDRACLAALDIIEGAKIYCKKLEKEKGIIGFNVRVGINTGLVVVAEVGADFRVEYTAMGDAVNIAARMESAAESGTIMITENTKKLIENNFSTESLGPINVKGKVEPINVFRLMKQKSQVDKSNTKSLVYSDLVDRENQISKLLSKIEELEKGNGNIVSIIGDHGIGKSRLVEELHKTTNKKIKWIEGRALAYNNNDSYWLAREVFKNLLEIFGEVSYSEMQDKLENYLRSILYFKNSEAIPYLSQFLKIPLEEKFKGIISNEDAKILKDQIHYFCKELLKAEGLKQPIVIVWEDLHWSDTPSLKLMKDLLTLSESIPILNILVFRMNEGEIWKIHEQYTKTSNDFYSVIQLNELDEENRLELLNHLSENFPISNELKKSFLERTGGNPFFIEEVLRSLIDKKLITTNGIEESDRDIVKEINIPNLLQNVMMSRIDCLENGGKITLQTASVIGKIFKEEVLKEICSSEMNEEQFNNTLSELKQKGFIEKRVQNINVNENIVYSQEYMFRHSLLQEVAYDSLLLSQRKKIHKRVGDTLENIFSENLNDLGGILAQHFEKGQDYEKSISYYIKAANYSENIFANNDAVVFYTKALKLGEHYNIKKSELANIYESLADLYFLIADYQKSIELYNESIKYIGSKEILADIHRKLGQVYERWGKYKEALQEGVVGIKLLNGETESTIAARIYTCLGMVHYRLGNLSESEKFNFRALEIFIKKENSIDLADVYNNLGLIFCKLENLERAMKYHRLCLAIRESIGNISGLAASYNNIGYLFQLQGSFNKAIEYYNKSIQFCEKSGNLHGLARSYDNLSQIYLIQKNEEMAMSFNLKAIELFGKIALEDTEVHHEVWMQSGVW